jgi:hypothetical protein
MGNFFASSLSNPKPMTSPESKINLLDQMHFYHVTQYCRSIKAVDIARIHTLSVIFARIKYGFGIKVTKGINNAIEKNGNQLWEEAITTEIK